MKKQMTKKLAERFSYVGYLSLSALPFLVSAQTGGNFTSVSGVWDFLCKLFNFLFIPFIFAAVVFVLLSAFKYLTAQGDAGKVKEAGMELLYAVVAVVVALIAKYVPKLAVDIAGISFPAGATLPSCLQ